MSTKLCKRQVNNAKSKAMHALRHEKVRSLEANPDRNLAGYLANDAGGEGKRLAMTFIDFTIQIGEVISNCETRGECIPKVADHLES